MKLLVIGGSGVLSSAMVDECILRGHEVTMLNRGNNTKFINPKATLIKCDVNNVGVIREKLANQHFDVLVDFIVFNLNQLKHSLKLFASIADQYVFISSAQVYNTSIKGELDENSETPQSLWSYSTNKEESEKYLKQYATDNGINYTIIRPGVNYDNRRIPYGMTPQMGFHWTMIERIKHGKPIITWNKGENMLNMTRVEDFAKGMVGLLGNTKAYNETFNVVGDYRYQWKDVLATLEIILNVKIRTIDIPVEFYASCLQGEPKEQLLGGRAQDLCCSNAKLKSVVTDFRTEYDLERGLRETLSYYENNNFVNGIDYNWDGDVDLIIKKYLRHAGLKRDKSLCFVNYDGRSTKQCVKLILNYYKRAIKRNNVIRKLMGR